MGSLVRATLIVAILAGLGAPAASAATKKITHEEFATLGQVTARLTYLERRHRDFSDYGDLRVSITRAGVPALDAPIDPPCSADYCRSDPAGRALFGDRRSVHVRDVGGSPEQEVIVDVYTGGVHCCEWAYVYVYLPASNSYALTTHNFGDPGYRIDDLQKDGSLEFVGGDYRFGYVFTGYAQSAFPVQIWRLDGQALVDVTRSFPALIRRDARRLLRYYRRYRKRDDVRGILAAYAADQCLLGKRRVGLRLARRAVKRHEVKRDLYPGGRKYLRSLRRHLKRWGYC
jgi:hypothetical protein